MMISLIYGSQIHSLLRRRVRKSCYLNMHRLVNLVVLCVCASVSLSHVLTHTTNDLVDTASGLISDTVIKNPDVKINTVDLIFKYIAYTRSSSVVSVKRYKRSVISDAHCPENQYRPPNFGRCYDCETYEEITGRPCPGGS